MVDRKLLDVLLPKKCALSGVPSSGQRPWQEPKARSTLADDLTRQEKLFLKAMRKDFEGDSEDTDGRSATISCLKPCPFSHEAFYNSDVWMRIRATVRSPAASVARIVRETFISQGRALNVWVPHDLEEHM
jgi:hypothetical protein